MKIYRKIPRLSILLAAILIAVHMLTPLALAHPLGNFTTNQYVGLHFSPERVELDFVLDMAEIPAFQEIALFDANGNDQLDASEAAGYHAAKCQTLQPDLNLQLEGHILPLALISSAVEFPPGAGGLPTLRLSCSFQASLPAFAEGAQVQFNNSLYPERLGWREITVTSEEISLPADLDLLRYSLSQRLTVYPKDLLSNPLDQRQLSFKLHLAGQETPWSPAADPQTDQPLTERNDGFTELIMRQDLTLQALLLTLILAFAWGAAHALTPGHGKTIVAAYLVGSRGTARHALFLGLTTTITHTAGVFMLGFLTLFASEFILPEQLYPWLGVTSGLLVMGLGLTLFRGRLLGLVGHPHSHDHTHLHDHHHSHDHSHPHSHDHHHYHHHLPPGADNSPVTLYSLLLLGVSGGLIPCPSALIVMLGAIALGRIGFGLALILAFSLGLASILTGIGLLWVQARRLFEYIPSRLLKPLAGHSRLFQLLPAASAAFIVIVGAGITFQALMQTGLLS